MKRIILGDNAEVLPTLPEKFARLIYIDPPFNTGKVQKQDTHRCRENTGYPTQKPPGVLNRIIKVHSRVDDVALDFFGGSGTTGEAAARNGRGFVLVDNNPDAVQVAAGRLAECGPSCEGFALVPAAQAARS